MSYLSIPARPVPPPPPLRCLQSLPGCVVVEVGPRLSFTSAFSTNATSVCQSVGVNVTRLERYRRYQLKGVGSEAPGAAAVKAFTSIVHDRMTEWCLRAPLESFSMGLQPSPVVLVPVLKEGVAALERANVAQGLSLDSWDLDYLLRLFRDDMKRDPTDVELFDFSQSNSEHSRHWFFRGRLVIDGEEVPTTLMDVVRETIEAQPANSVIAFADNSSAIRGYSTALLLPDKCSGVPTGFSVRSRLRHLLLTAETHNFPTGIAPHPGAETGTGGRIRDSHATGRGSYPIAGTAGYCVGALNIPGHRLPWEDPTLVYPSTMAKPLEIEIQASNGASEYGNKFGEPVISGFTRSVCMILPSGERREYIKPIMFTAGIGAIDDDHTAKGEPEAGMVVVKLGGPAYRIGMGGSAASSMMQGENREDLDFNAVQRGDAEMEHKVNRVIRACCEMGPSNPIVSIHDQGAGGNCNVLKEIISPVGGRIDVRKIILGDATLSVLEIWGAEYQEADALLIRPESVPLFTALCARERAPVAYVGEITGDQRAVLFDSADGSTPVNFELEKVLGKMPQKTFTSTRAVAPSTPLTLPLDLDAPAALDRVLRLLSVGSKRFLTNKVDRSVTGLIAQQQCVGPLHTPLADCSVVSLSHFDVVGIASSIGEQPLKGLVSPRAMGRMAVAEAITNLCAARISSLTDVKCSANWMWAAKLPHEGAALFDACRSMADFMIATGVSVDGGKDSLSMATKLPSGEVVKAPGSLVISLYAPCSDVRVVFTPDLKAPGSSELIFVDLSARAGQPLRARAGGSALAQVYGQAGALVNLPDCEDPSLLVAAFNCIQALMSDRSSGLLSYHDRSDGGLITTLLEMAFAGDCGFDVSLPQPPEGVSPIDLLFAEEVGMVLEVATGKSASVLSALSAAGVSSYNIGRSLEKKEVSVRVGGAVALPTQSMAVLRDVWESTSFALEALQCNPACVASEQQLMKTRKRPAYRLTFDPIATARERILREPSSKPRVAVLREEGSNGDREMTAALWSVGFDAWDVTMSDLLSGRAVLDGFRGIVFPGGFSYADVLDSAKGWAGTIKFSPLVLAQFSKFYSRSDTFSLGVCNGCQLMALLGWVPFGPDAVPVDKQPRFVHNASGRFESRFSTVVISPSPAVLFRGMAGSILGVWVSHGEGRAHFPDSAMAADATALAPLHYVDDEGNATEIYPFNPNGSPRGIAGLCSRDGRHLAVMPHPERTVRTWQCPWAPEEWRARDRVPGASVEAPWSRMFQNAMDFCEESR